jgi:hypothetical protein
VSTNTREKRDQIEALDLLAFVHSIVSGMPGWQVVEPGPDLDDYPPHEGRRRLSSVSVRHTSGATFYVHRSTWPPELNVGAMWPREGDTRTGQEYRPHEGAARIGVSPWRDPEVLAKDILRRFVVPFLPLWDKQKAIRDECVRKAAAAHLLAQALAKVLGEGLRDYSEGWRLYAGGCEVRVSRWGSVQFERLSTEDPARARALARLLAGWQREDAVRAIAAEHAAEHAAERAAERAAEHAAERETLPETDGVRYPDPLDARDAGIS